VARELRFECQPGCTECCTQKGFVYLNADDVSRAAAFLGLSAAEFERRYVYRTRKKMRLRVPKTGHCHFLDGGGCRIHTAKPLQCRTYPFWPELIASARAWKRTSRICPGIGKGPLIQIEIAREISRDMREGLRELYEC
jgi:uncharacterized protein